MLYILLSKYKVFYCKRTFFFCYLLVFRRFSMIIYVFIIYFYILLRISIIGGRTSIYGNRIIITFVSGCRVLWNCILNVPWTFIKFVCTAMAFYEIPKTFKLHKLIVIS